MRGATLSGFQRPDEVGISIHTPHAGSDMAWARCRSGRLDFNPHSPCGERRSSDRAFQARIPISIHTPHAGSDAMLTIHIDTASLISIHTPHAGSDEQIFKIVPNPETISIHTPHAGSDIQPSSIVSKSIVYFNPHSPCGERLDHRGTWLPAFPISIHTPHAGSDQFVFSLHIYALNFNPHSPCGERPGGTEIIPGDQAISIHTPHAGSDGCLLKTLFRWNAYFNPHSPCGERLFEFFNQSLIFRFQSTLPMRGATFRITARSLSA